MKASIQAIEYHLPEDVLSTQKLAAEHPDWAVEKIDAVTGIRERHITAPGVCASDLAVVAAEKLFGSGVCRPDDVEYVLFCTQSPDYFLPTTACLLQDRLGIPTSAGAIDFNQGCSGYVYGLSLAQGLIETGQVKTVLLLTAETYTQLIHPRDRSARAIFGDAGAATLLHAVDSAEPVLGPFVFGTDGRGAPNLIVPAGGMRLPRSAETARASEDENGNTRSRDNLFMDGREIVSFTISTVPGCVEQVLAKAGRRMEEIDLVVFHQANHHMLEHLRRQISIPKEKFVESVAHCGNTVSSTIPIALKDALGSGRLAAGMLVLVVGWGVGYSWAGTLVRWQA